MKCLRCDGRMFVQPSVGPWDSYESYCLACGGREYGEDQLTAVAAEAEVGRDPTKVKGPYPPNHGGMRL